jgi:hypothetical protein
VGSLCSNIFNVPDLNLHVREKYEENLLIAWSNCLMCVQNNVGDLMFLVFMVFCLLVINVEPKTCVTVVWHFVTPSDDMHWTLEITHKEETKGLWNYCFVNWNTESSWSRLTSYEVLIPDLPNLYKDIAQPQILPFNFWFLSVFLGGGLSRLNHRNLGMICLTCKQNVSN